MNKSSLRQLLVSLIILMLVMSPFFSSLSILNVKATRDFPPVSLTLHLASPINTTYNQNSILINFSFQKQPDDWNHYLIEYAVDGERANYSGTFVWMQQLTGLSEKNFTKTISGIPDGTYLLTISAKWMGVLMWYPADKETVTFTIDTKTPTPSPMPTPTISATPENQHTLNTQAIIGITIILAVLGVGLSLLVYLIKRK